VLDGVYSGGGDMAAVTGEISRLLRDCLIVKLMPGGTGLLSGGYDEAPLADLARKATGERLYDCMEAASRVAQDISRGLNGKLAAELCVVGLCDERIGGSI
jgi:DNA polymerase-3 subunit gamma/tau